MEEYEGGEKSHDSSILLVRNRGQVKKNKFHAQAHSLKESFRAEFPDFKYKRRVKRKTLQANRNKDPGPVLSNGIHKVQGVQHSDDYPLYNRLSLRILEHQGQSSLGNVWEWVAPRGV